jgi:hypothetical protein
MSSPDLDAVAVAEMSEEARRRLFTALVRDFAQRGAGAGSPIDETELTAPEVAVTVAAMMKAAEVTSFEVAALFNV